MADSIIQQWKMAKWLSNSQFELREARALIQTPSRRAQAPVGEHAQIQTQLTPESHHRIKPASQTLFNLR